VSRLLAAEGARRPVSRLLAIHAPYRYATALAVGLAASTALRVSAAGLVVLAVVVAAIGAAQPRLVLACVLLGAGWWWGSERLRALDRSVLVQSVETAGAATVTVEEPPKRGRFDVHVRAIVVRWRGNAVHEPVLLQLPPSRAPPQGSRLHVFGTLRAPPGYERSWLRRHGVHVVLRATRAGVIRASGGIDDRLHAWLVRASTPGLTGERRAVLQGVVLGEDGGLSDSLRQRFRASGLYHLLAVSGGNVLVVGGGTASLAIVLGVSRLAAEALALVAIAAYVLAVGPQPSVLRAGIAGALLSLAWLTGRQRDRWYSLLLAAVALLAWNPWNVLDPGFQLSFVAVGSIFVVAPRVRRALEGYPLPAWSHDCIAVSTACGLSTAPISWLHFHAVPVLTVPANAAAAPVVAPMLALALLAAVVPPFGRPLAQLSGLGAAYLAGCARFFGGLPGAQARSPAAVAGLASIAALGAAYAWRRAQRAEAGLPSTRKRQAEDLPRGAPAP
jgi:ComEC/Rec2-related protein